MKTYGGTIILTLFALLFAFAIFNAMPAQEVPKSDVPIIRNTAFPLASIANPECQYNAPDLYVIEPKPYEQVKGTVNIRGQAVGSFENTVVMEIADVATGKALLQGSTIVEPHYPCSFSGAFSVGNLAPGSYTARGYFSSPKDGSVVKEVEVPIRIE